MKTTSTLLTAIFMSIASFAVPAQSKLSITVNGHQNIQILVDNNRYKGGGNSIVLNNLQPGSHTIKVYSLRKKRKSIWGYNNDTELIYSSSVYVRSGYFTGITIDRYGKAKIDERALRSNRRKDEWENDRKGNHNDQNEDRYNDRNDQNEDRYNDRNDRYNDGCHGRDDYYRRPASEQSFTSMVQSLRREYAENSRVVLAKQIIDRNYFSTAQVKYMLQLFPFEHHKLDLAKYAYPNTSDQRNYFSVYDVFTYSNSKEQLADYIRRFR